MVRVEYRPSASVTLSLPVSLVLAGLFFLPWLEVQCNGSSSVEAGKLGAASGWQLARGEIAPEPGYAGQVGRFYGQDLPHKRPWVFVALAVPFVLALATTMCLSGSLSPSITGKLLVVGALGGLAVTILVCCLDYGVGDFASTLHDGSDGASQRRVPIWERGKASREAEAQRQAREEKIAEVRRMITVRPTPYLWASLGLYGLLALCGVVTTTVAVTPARTAYAPGPPLVLHAGGVPSPAATGRPPTGYHVYQANRPYQPEQPGRAGSSGPPADPQASPPPQPPGRWHE